MQSPKPNPHAFRDASRHFEDGLARICGLYGVNPLAGRLYAVLFVAAEPVSLDELCERVSAAKSTVSVALRTLLAARVVRRLPRRNDRRDWYEAVADPWELLSEWNRLFFQPEIAMWRETGSELERALSARDAPAGRAKQVIRERIAALAEFVALFEELLGTIERPRATRARTIAVRGGAP